MTAFFKIVAILCLVGTALAVCGQQRTSPTSPVREKTNGKPIFTGYAPYLCVGYGFVAMAGISRRAQLLVIPIDVNGIEAPQIIPWGGDEVRGMQCGGSHIELLAYDYKSSRLITTLYTVQWHSQESTTIREGQREDLGLLKSGSASPAVEFRREFLEWGGNRAGGFARGDWYVEVPGVVDRPNNTYEVHFIHTITRGNAILAVTLLEETLDKKKVTRSVPLVYIEAAAVED
ncbi:MAG: hypothetical protein WBE86_09435 [Candidatus Acidiferrales bacterium]